jgi:hypothetical protein
MKVLVVEMGRVYGGKEGHHDRPLRGHNLLPYILAPEIAALQLTKISSVVKPPHPLRFPSVDSSGWSELLGSQSSLEEVSVLCPFSLDIGCQLW